MRIGRHQFADRAQKIEVGEDHAWQQITLGKHADRTTFLVNHDQAADLLQLHLLQCRTRRRVCADADRLALDELPELGGHRVLFGRTLREVGLQLPARLIEQAGDVLRAEQMEDRAHLHQPHEFFGTDLQAEAVFDCYVSIGRRALGRYRSDREALALAQVQAGVLGGGGRAGLTGLDLAALDDVEMARGAHLRGQDVVAARVKGEHCVLREEGKGIRLHVFEGGEPAQEVGAGAHQQVGGIGGHDGSVVD